MRPRTSHYSPWQVRSSQRQRATLSDPRYQVMPDVFSSATSLRTLSFRAFAHPRSSTPADSSLPSVASSRPTKDLIVSDKPNNRHRRATYAHPTIQLHPHPSQSFVYPPQSGFRVRSVQLKTKHVEVIRGAPTRERVNPLPEVIKLRLNLR